MEFLESVHFRLCSQVFCHRSALRRRPTFTFGVLLVAVSIWRNHARRALACQYFPEIFFAVKVQPATVYGMVNAITFDFTVKVCQKCVMVLMVDRKEWVVAGEQGRPGTTTHTAILKPRRSRRQFLTTLLVPFSALPYLQTKADKN